MALKKLYYEEVRPLDAELRHIYEIDAENHDMAYDTLLLYMLHKGGLLESGIPVAQFEAMSEAFIEGMNIMAVVIEDQKYIA